jgi:phosphatidate cytidylyltransferase
MLKQRLITAVVLLIIVCAILFFTSSMVFQIAAGLVLLAATWEWGALLGSKDSKLIRALLVLLVALAYLEALLFLLPIWSLLAAAVATIWGFAAVVAYDHKKQPAGLQYPLLRVLACLLLIAPTMMALFLLRVGPHGPGMVFYALSLVFINDSAAYFGGRAMGKTKLAALVSPKKTWEGCLVGFLAGIIWAIAIPLVVWPGEYNWFLLLVVAIPTLIASVIGDLFISVLKRQIQIKDTGSLLPGHGGLLDRIDAVLMGIPVFALVAMLVGVI